MINLFKIISLLVYLVLIKGFSYAQYKGEQNAKVNKTINYCIKKDFENIKCNIKSTEEFSHKQGFISKHVGGRLYDTIRLANYGLEKILSEFNGDTSNSENYDPCSELQENPLTYIEKAISNYAEVKELKACQAACLVKCVTSKYITYDPNSRAASIQTPNQIAKHAKGICGDFANFSNYLLETIGHESEIEYGAYTTKGENSPHNWTSITINNEKYWFEPQRAMCTFYKD